MMASRNADVFHLQFSIWQSRSVCYNRRTLDKLEFIRSPSALMTASGLIRFGDLLSWEYAPDPQARVAVSPL